MSPRRTASVDEWYCDLCSKSFPTMRGRDFHMTRWCPENPDADRPGRRKKTVAPVVEEVDDVTEETAPLDSSSPFAEPAPVEAPKRGWKDKLWGAAEPPKTPVTTLERRPRKRRVSTDGIWQFTWTGVGTALVRTGADIPVGNAMSFQAPIVGSVLDEAIEGTFIDTLLQPLASSGKRFKKVSDVVSLPVLVGVMERSPSLAPVLEPLLRQVIREHLVVYAKMAKQQRKADDEYRRALEDLGQLVDDDPVDGIMAQIWARPTGAPGEPTMNGHADSSHVNV